MKQLLLVIAILLSFSGLAEGQIFGPASQVRFGPTDPTKCTPGRGQIFENTTSHTIKNCTATDTWSSIGGGGGGPVSNPVTTAQGGLGADNSASSGVPLFATGVVTFTSSTGTGSFARAGSPTFTGTPLVTVASSNTSLGAAAEQFTVKNTDTTTNNYSQITFQNDQGSVGVSLATQYTDHTAGAQTSKFHVMTRTGGSFADRLVLDNTGLSLSTGETYQINGTQIAASNLSNGTTGSGAITLATSPTFVMPLLGTPTSGVATNLTGLPLTTGVTGTLPVGNGGTGQTTYTKGDLLTAPGGASLNKLAVGTDGQVLTADAASTNGVKWATGGGGSGTVNSGTTPRLAYYATTGTAVSDTPGFTYVASGQGIADAGSAVSGGATLVAFTPGAHTGVTAEVIDYNHAAHTQTITAGYTTQRSVVFDQPTISAATALTVTNAATVAIVGAPIAAGAGPAAITNPLALWVQGGNVRFDGTLLQFNGSTGSFPALRRSGTTIQAVVGDQSGYAGFFGNALTIEGGLLGFQINAVGSVDVALGRNAAGVAEINSGVAGTLRDLVLRNITIGSGTQITKHLSATATLDFGNLVSIGCEDLTVTVTGAAVGDTVALGVPNGSVPDSNFFFPTPWVSSSNTVTVRGCSLVSGNPASGTFRVDVWAH